jgi:hypothetical protein
MATRKIRAAWETAAQKARLVPMMVIVLLFVGLTGCGSPNNAPSDLSTDSTGSKPSTESAPLPATESEFSPPAPPSGGSDDLANFNPCEMLTPEEVEGFFEGPMAPDAAPESIGPYRSCMFTNQAGGKMIIVQVTHETPAQFKADNEGSAAMLEMIPTPVAGLGDESVFFSGLLRVRVGDRVLQVVTWHPEDQQEEAFAMTQEIARLALNRMP